MDEQALLAALALGEDRDREFKSARGGLPRSLWETYSAMANTDGGAIALGVEQDGTVSGLDDPIGMKKSFWDTINNRGRVSANLLTDDDAKVQSAEGKQVLVIRVPRATRRQRPVYVGQNPLTGTFRRNYEGDYHCTEAEVGRMLADRSEEPADSQILMDFGLQDLDEASIQQYRQRFAAISPAHPWLGEDVKGLLEKLGGWRTDRTTKEEGPTVAGLLMFGETEAIRDPHAVPEFHLDYRERLSEDRQIRWTDRLTIDGMWVANVFQFYQRAIPKLTSDLKMPFRLDPDLFRKDDTIVHEAIREALVNALIHADYRGQGGIVVEKYRDRFEFSNPGSLLVSFDQILVGGVSECRNKGLQTMFQMIGGGEKAGSGIDKIRQGWRSQQWRSPRIRETVQPDRVSLVLPMVGLLPDDSVQRLGDRFGRKFRRLAPLEVQALVTADIEGEVSNSRMRELSTEHPADLTRMLQGLAQKGLLLPTGQKRGAAYRLPQQEGDSSHRSGDSSHNRRDSSHKPMGSVRSLQGLPAKALTKLQAIAAPSCSSSRLPPAQTRQIILRLCEGRELTAAQLGELLNRSPVGLRNRFLTPMAAEGLLVRKYPSEPNRPDQAYSAATRTRC